CDSWDSSGTHVLF
nr:immunoglobulin light chain junction region [Macaca mulatta]MPO04499.1 immunoglobulin light chain junction region [Macaca mulatta]MPO05066.1 immunoglobulin light chain junction region [Macaca mulatta]MPO05214.1 immunoglobulin light chain junction region [Macaca mulatta]MPO05225.1 immunoglobulin light chain junction region [Macaca mulatta]